jgi:hypothetical protein
MFVIDWERDEPKPQYGRDPDWWKDNRLARPELAFIVGSTGSLNDLKPSKLEQRFEKLVQAWESDVEAVSSSTIITSNIHYLTIISLGKPVLPLILRRLRTKIEPWFVALMAITEKYDIGKDSPGDYRKIAAAWVKWGEDNHII